MFKTLAGTHRCRITFIIKTLGLVVALVTFKRENLFPSYDKTIVGISIALNSFIISNISFAKKSGCTDGDCNNGFGTWTYTDKTTYVGQWENGSKKGKGTETWPNGYIYEGEFSDSKWHGKGTLKFPDGSTYIGEWKNNKMHGKGIFTWSDGKIINGTWNEGDYVK